MSKADDIAVVRSLTNRNKQVNNLPAGKTRDVAIVRELTNRTASYDIAPVQTTTAKKKSASQVMGGTFLGGWKQPEAKEKKTPTAADIAAQQREAAEAAKRISYLEGLDLKEQQKKIDALSAESKKGSRLNIQAFGAYDVNNRTDVEKELAKAQEDYNYAESLQYRKKGDAALSALDAETQQLIDIIARYNIDARSLRGNEVGENEERERTLKALMSKGMTAEEIEQLVDYRMRQVNEQEYDEKVSNIEELASRDDLLGISDMGAIAASILSVPLNLASGAGYLDLLMQSAHNKQMGYDRPLDYKTGAMSLYGQASAAREIVSQNIIENAETETGGQVASFLYQTGMSMADSAVVAGLGVLGLGTAGTLLLGGSAATAAAVDAKNRGGSDSQALWSGALAGAAETVFERISIDSLLTGKYTKDFVGSEFKKLWLDVGVQGAVEGSEELFTAFANHITDRAIMGGSSNYAKSIREYMEAGMTEDEAKARALADFAAECATSFVGGVISGSVMGGFANAARPTVGSYTTKTTENDQKVIDKLVENSIAEAEKDGKTLTDKEKAKLRDDVMETVERGEVSFDTIAEVLDKEGYDAYKNLAAEEQKAIEELAELYEGEELQQEVAKFLEGAESKPVRSELDKKVFGMVKDGKLAESYLERGRRSQAYEADVSRYDEKQRATIQNAINSGVLNNTKRTHEFVDLIAKISADKGVAFDFTNNEKLRGSIFAVEGKTVNGYVTENGVTLNIDSSKALNSVVGHEITHVLEGTKLYDELQTVLFEYAKSRKATDGKFDNEYKERLYAARQLYKDVDGYQGVQGFEKIKKEVVADLVGDYLFTDADFVNNLVKNKNLFQKLWNEIKYLHSVSKAGSKEEKQLLEVKRAFEKAYQNNGKAEDNRIATDEGNVWSDIVGTKYSLKDSEGRQLSEAQAEFFKDSKVRDENGNLLVVYHGTPRGGFNEFSHAAIGTASDYGYLGRGFYFTPSERVAKYYAGYLNTSEVKTGYVNITNPLTIPSKRDIAFTLESIMGQRFDGEDANYERSAAFTKWLEDNGYDGVICRDEIMALHSNQFKNIDNLNPTEDPDIRYSLSDYSYDDALLYSADDFTNEGLIRNYDHRDIVGDIIKKHFNSEYRLPFVDLVDVHLSGGMGSYETFYTTFYFRDEALEDEYGVNSCEVRFSNHDAKYSDSDIYLWNSSYETVTELIRDMEKKVTEFAEENGVDVSYGGTRYSISDSDYLAAVKRGDMDTAQKMVDEAAKAAGYTVKAYHGTPGKEFSVFDSKKIGSTTDEGVFGSGFYFTTDKNTADGYATENGNTMPVYLNVNKAWWAVSHRNIQKAAEELGMDESALLLREYGSRGKIVAPILSQTRQFASHLQERGYDSVIVQHGKNNYEIVVFDNKAIKSADPVTYDDNGNIIPLSQRFNPQNNDIRYSLSEQNAEHPVYGDYNVYGEEVAIAPVAENETVEDIAPVAEKAEPVDVSESPVLNRLNKKLSNSNEELENNKRLREESNKSFDEKIAKAQAELDAKANKDTQEANAIKRRIERLQRLKADRDAEYAKRISDISARVSRTEENIAKYHPGMDRAEKAVERIDKMLEYDKAELSKEYNETKALLADKNAYISSKASELYDEIRNLKKGVRASALLGELLDSGYEWSSIRSALNNIKYTPDHIVNVNSAAESRAREILNEDYENSVYNLDEDYAARVKQLEEEAAKKRKSSTVAYQRKKKQQEYYDQMAELAGDTSTWVDKRLGISYRTNTLKRNLRDIVRDAKGNQDIAKADAIYNELQGKYNTHEAMLNRESTEIKKPYADMKITKAEDEYIQMLGEFRHNPDTTLTEDAVKEFYEKHKDDIDTTKVDKAIEMARQTYDELLIRVNNVLREQGMKEIPYRKGYFPHFTEEKQNFLAKLFNWKVRNNDIPTDIAGLTENFNPNRSWQSFNKQRKSDITDYSFTRGMDTYVQGALDWVYHIEDIQKRRAFENYIRYVHSDKGVQEKIDAIKRSNEYDADEAQEQIDLVLNEARNPLNNFVTDLRAGTNTLANKKSSLDRTVEELTSRKFYSVMTNVSNRVSANMVAGSVSSALTNFIPITQSWGEVSPISSLRAMVDTLRSTFRDDGVVNKSDFLTNRLRKADNLYKTGWDKVSDKVGLMMEAVDGFTSQTVWRSRYMENISKGMSESEAIADADQFAESVIAGRSRGNMPTIFDSKNPLVKTLTAFQLEVANQYGYMFKDMPQDMKNESVGKLVKGYATMFLGAYAYNALYSSLTGRDSAFDPIGIIEELLRDLGLFDEDEEEEPVEAAWNLFENVVQEVPFVGGLLGGGRIPIASALPYSGDLEQLKSGVEKLIDRDFSEVTSEWLKPVYYLALPMGGGQIKKTTQGLQMFSDDHPVAGSYTKSGNLRFPVEDTLASRAKAAIFGQYASKNAREYFDNNLSPLREKQIQEYIDSGMDIEEYWEYRKGLAKQDTVPEKLDYIAGLDLPISTKNILANNAVTRKNPIDMADYE